MFRAARRSNFASVPEHEHEDAGNTALRGDISKAANQAKLIETQYIGGVGGSAGTVVLVLGPALLERLDFGSRLQDRKSAKVYTEGWR